MNLKAKKVLVTGADGFIGSHLVESLLGQAASVKAFVYYNSFNSLGWIDSFSPTVKKNIEIFAGDIRDPNGVRESMKDVDVVFHLAALIGIPFSYHSPDSYVDTNIKGTLNVLQAANVLGTEKIIHTSTSEAYGTAQFVPITEEHPLVGQSPYSATKIGADQLAISFYRSFQCPVVLVRPFNAYGPRQSARAVIPTIISQLSEGNGDVKLGSVTPTRDFTYVTDTVDGFIAAAKSEGVNGEVFNIGSAFEISIKDTIDTIAEIMGCQAKIIADDARLRPEKSEVQRLWADNSKALEKLSWTPRHASLKGFREGLEKTIAWFKDPLNRKFYKAGEYNI